MKLIIAIQSASDIITNSSSEVFLCQNNTTMSIQELKDFLYEYNRSNQFTGDWETWQKMSPEERDKYDTSGGMGGFLEICSYDELDDDYWLKKLINECYDNPKQYLVVDTDWCHNATIAWITENLNAINTDCL
jgi:hypothetical protein